MAISFTVQESLNIKERKKSILLRLHEKILSRVVFILVYIYSLKLNAKLKLYFSARRLYTELKHKLLFA